MTKEEFPYWNEEETMKFLNYNESSMKIFFKKIRLAKEEYYKIFLKYKKLADENLLLKEHNRLLVKQFNDISLQLKSLEILKENSKDTTEIISEVDINFLKILSTPIEDLKLSVRSYNRLRIGQTNIYDSDKNNYIHYEIKSLGDVLHHYKNKNLVKLTQFGRGSIWEIEDVLEKYGLVDSRGKVIYNNI
jgi:DNA-directed RNA polymerase alpha subunit